MDGDSMPVDIDIYDGSSYHPTVVDMDEREEDYIIFVDDAAGPSLSLVVDWNDWILQTNASESYGFNLIYDPLGDGTQFVSYTDSVIAKGGAQPYSFSVVAGSLPDGIELGDANGSCEIDIDDAVYLIMYAFGGGAPPLPGCVLG